MIETKRTIAFTGGGTAGHVFPAFPVIARLRALDVDVFWIGSSDGMERRLVEEAGIRYVGVPSGKLRRYFSLKNFTDLFRILAGFFAARRILKKERPQVLMSKGGFVSVPPAAAAKTLGIPCLTHESDVDPGLATRLNLKLGARPLLAYRRTLDDLSEGQKLTAEVVGNPVRDALLSGQRNEGRRLAGLADDDRRPLLLVLGGSQGAREINDLVGGCLDRLLKTCAVVHQTGPGNPALSDRSGYMNRPFFREELPHLLAAADLAVARSGAGSVWELAATRTPAVYVPLRGATRGDQLLNASVAEERGVSVTLESGADPERLASIVLELLSDSDRLENMKRSASAYAASTAADRIVTILMEYMK
jgi:UDP-N-acetylglucosamine--N-acetylmuramyl-(pentapeptide) pyrophosphoryl-undecaprenol N-acetylglucosamine transferase